MYGISRTEPITSAANPLIKDLRRAVSRGERTGDGLWVAEGFHLLEEARRSKREIPVVVASESAVARLEARLEAMVEAMPARPVRLVVLPDALFQSVAATETSQGVIALVRPPEWRVEDLFRGCAMIAVLDGLQDPGNAGAVVRAAEAFGATGVLFVKGSAGPFHPKTLRASAGSLFRVPFLADVSAEEAAAMLRRLDIYAAMPFTGSERLADDVDFTRPCALVVGNEGRGVSGQLRAVSTAVAIPTVGVESLNASVAAAVLLYEIRRQRA